MLPPRTVKALSKSLATAFLGTAMLLGALLAPGHEARAQQADLSRIASAESGAPEASAPQQRTVALSRLEDLPAKLDQVISLRLSEATLEEALGRIARQTGLGFVYGRDAVASGVQITTDLEAVPARAALERVLRGTGRTLVLSESGQLILTTDPSALTDRAGTGVEGAAPRAQAPSTMRKMQAMLPEALRAKKEQPMQGTITGTITNDATGETLPGVSVTLEGTQLGAATGADGTYTIQGVEPGTYTVRASFVGFGDEVKEGVEVQEGETTTVDIAMQQKQVGLDEVVVVGYGEQQRRDLTGAVSSVSSEQIEAAPSSSVEQALQGRVAGVQVTQNSSKPGGGISVRIRGTGSVQSGAEPLYVIDGVPVYNNPNSVPGSGGEGGGQVSPNPLSSINPQDIESIEVLKDASATAIYGARGANGVVLITTKQGRGGETRVDFSSSLGTQRVAGTYDLVSASQYAQLVNERRVQSGSDPIFENPESFGAGNDTQDLIYDAATMQNYQLGVRGGGDQTNFVLSGNFHDEEGVVRGSGFRRYSFRANIDRDVSDRFRVGTNVTVGRSLYNQTPTEGESAVRGAVGGALLTPALFALRNENGEYVSSVEAASALSQALGNETSTFPNPLAQINEISDETAINRVLGNAHAEFDLMENLYVRTNFGADIEDIAREGYVTRFAPYSGRGTSSASDLTSQRRNFLSENLLKYNATFSDVHSVDATAGFTWQQETSEGQGIYTSNFINDITRNDDLGAGNPEGGPNVYSFASEWTLLSYLGRVNYTYDDTYLFTVTGRYDGSSKFGEGSKWGFFPSGAVGWRIIEEDFMQEQDIFSNLKLRVSYGVAGNQEIGTYSSLASLATTTYNFLGQQRTGFIPESVANPDLKWEESRQLDVGLDMGFLDQRVRVTADYYRKNTDDLILPVTLPMESDFNTAIQNTGSIRNTGFEFSVGADLLTGQDGGFSWSSNFNASVNNNEVTDLGVSSEFFGPRVEAGRQVFENGSLVREGAPIGAFFGYQTDGVFSDQDEIDAHGVQPDAQPGDLKFVDTNGDGEISAADRTVLGTPYADYTFGWDNRFSYGGFGLTFALEGSQGNDVTNLNLIRLEVEGGTVSNATARRFEDRWTPENRDAEYPRAGYRPGAVRIRNDRLVEDASYIRLTNVTLSYDLPMDLIGIGSVRSARLYLRGRDLVTITDYFGYNPNVNSKASAAINRGYDQNAYPFARKYTVGVDLRF